MQAPQKRESPLAGGQFAEENIENALIIGATLIDCKTLASLRARFALLGHELHVVRKDSGTYFEIRRWGQCRTCSTLHDLQGFLVQIGGAA